MLEIFKEITNWVGISAALLIVYLLIEEQIQYRLKKEK
jgi:hypothetical protein